MSPSSEKSAGNKAPEKEIGAGIRVTVVSILVNSVLIFLKIWVGIESRSQALIADGIHSISDLFSDAIVLLGLKFGRKEADEDHPYGHARIETFAGLVVGLLLIMVAFWILVSAVLAIYHDHRSEPTIVTIAAALVCLIAKEVMYWYTITVGRRLRSLALIGNAWHHRSDALSSVAVLAGVFVTYLNPDWYLADSIAAIVVTIFIFKAGTSLSLRAFREVVDTAPDRTIVADIETRACDVPGVREVHDIFARTHGANILVELHVVVDPDLSVREGHDIAKAVEKRLLGDVADVTRVVVHVDPDGVRSGD